MPSTTRKDVMSIMFSDRRSKRPLSHVRKNITYGKQRTEKHTQTAEASIHQNVTDITQPMMLKHLTITWPTNMLFLFITRYVPDVAKKSSLYDINIEDRRRPTALPGKLQYAHLSN